jgi:Spx/MgsR family transcriptional regulator
MIILYGLATCDTVKKARYWFDVNKVDYKFHEIRRDGLPLELLQQFAARLDDWQVLVNRKGMTWRKFSPEQQQLCAAIETALPLIVENPTLMKRPVIDNGAILLVGFDTRMYEKHFL